MGLMDDAMQSDSGFSADTDEFAEAVTYTRAGGGSSTVNAVIDRTPPARDQTFANNTRVFDVWIPYDATVGLTSIPTKGDSIAVKNDPADAGTVTKTFTSLVEADSAGWLCEFA